MQRARVGGGSRISGTIYIDEADAGGSEDASSCADAAIDWGREPFSTRYMIGSTWCHPEGNERFICLLRYKRKAMIKKTKARAPMAAPTFAPVEIVVGCE